MSDVAAIRGSATLLGEQDKAAMRRQSNFSLVLAITCWAAGIAEIVLLERAPLAVVVGVFVSLGGIGFFLLGQRLRADVNDGTLRVVEGQVSLNVSNFGKGGVHYSARIGEHWFSVSKEVCLSLGDGQSYRAYYTPRTHRAIRWDRMPRRALALPEAGQKWMAYITEEVRSACDEKGWGYQIRRKWSVRYTPVAESPVDDYEWKLVPDATGQLPDHEPRSGLDEGTYYVLGFGPPGRLLLQHDYRPRWDLDEVITYTEIRPVWDDADPPPGGWLKKHLIELTSRFEPNLFSIT
jgi:hypothetical protein